MRKFVREDAMKIIYATNASAAEETLEYFLESVGEEESVCAQDEMSQKERDFLKTLVLGTCENCAEIDSKIEPLLKKWTLSRLPRISLAILRLGVFELCYYDDTPTEIAINEAVEIAKKYGDEDAPAFINGVLGAMAQDE